MISTLEEFPVVIVLPLKPQSMLQRQRWVFCPIFLCPLYGHAGKSKGYFVECRYPLSQAVGALTPKKDALVNTSGAQNLLSLTCLTLSNLSRVFDGLSTAKASCIAETRTEYSTPGRVSHILKKQTGSIPWYSWLHPS